MSTLLVTFIGLAILGFAAYLILKLVPMPEPIKGAVTLAMALLILLWLLGRLGGLGL